VNTAEIILNFALLFCIGSFDLFGDKPSSRTASSCLCRWQHYLWCGNPRPVHPNAAGAKLMAVEVHRYLK